MGKLPIREPSSFSGVELAINNETSDFTLTTGVGPALSLSCAIQNNSQEEQLLWYRGDGAVDLKDGNQMNASHLCLSPVTETDNGVTFTCKLKRDQSIQVSVILDVQCELMRWVPPESRGSEEPVASGAHTSCLREKM